MTDEQTQTEQPDEEPQVPVYARLAEMWASYYTTLMPFVTGDTVNKRDIQQYRLKVMDLAYALTELTLKIGLVPK